MVCVALSSCLSRNCNRIFVSCCSMHDTAYLYDQPLWSWSLTTAWRRVVAVMKQAEISEGPHRVPKS